MASPAKTVRTLLSTVAPAGPQVPVSDAQEDFSAFQVRVVIRDFKLSAELFASNGEIVLICGRNNQEKQGMLLVSYEIPASSSAFTAPIRLSKVQRLSKKTVSQLETVPILKIALLLGDGIISILDIDTLQELTTVPVNNITLFSTWYEIPSSSVASPIRIPTELRIGSALRRRTLVSHRWLPQQKRIEENKDSRGGFELFDTPRVMGLSHDKVCIGYRKNYSIVSLITGLLINELPITTGHEPMINCLQDRTQWCVQMDTSTIFLNSDFEPLYKNGVVWKDVPSGIVQASPYVLALMNQSIDICTFNGSQSVPVQQIPHKGLSAIGKCRLWMDAQTQRIYSGTPTDVVVLEPISVPIQLQNYMGTYKYDLALILIRAVLGMSMTSSVSDGPRNADGHARGNLDQSTMPKEVVFPDQAQPSNRPPLNSVVSRQPSTSETPRRNSTLGENALWIEYYRIGTMYAFQLFHRQQFEQAFAEFNEFLTDPAEIISLCGPLSGNVWLTTPYNEFRAFVNQHRHFAEPADFVGVKFENALHELQRYLTDLRRVFQVIFRRAPNSWLEVQSLVKNRLILRSVRDLLVIVETALLKAYLIDNNNILANALLRNQDNCCLPSEVEKELKKHHRRAELVLFFEKQNRHQEALELITKTEALSARDGILNYLMKLDNSQLPLIFEYVGPMLKSALAEKNSQDILHNILILFVGDITPMSPSAGETPSIRTIRLDPLQVFQFLKSIDQDFSILYLENICMKPELGLKQREIQNQLVYAYCDRIKQLSKELRPMIKSNQQQTNERPKDELYQDNDLAASQSFSGANIKNYATISPIKRQINEYDTKLKQFLLNQKCTCDFEKLEAYFLQEKSNPTDEDLFSLHYAIVLGKLGRHEEALRTFVENGFYTDAENYCETIFSNGDDTLARNLYRQLIEHYLGKSQEGNLKENSLKPILRIVNNASDRLDPVQTLEILPPKLKLSSVKGFIEHSLQTCSTKKRSSQLERNLLFLKLLRAQSKRISSENHSFTIDADSTCARAECFQPFNATQAVVRFPNNKMVHLHCRSKYEKEQERNARRQY